jgi:hypothetical protein
MSSDEPKQPTELGTLRADLEQLAQKTGRGLARARAMDALGRILPRVMRALWLPPFLGLGLALVGVPLPLGWLLLGFVLVVLVLVAWPMLKHLMRPVGREEALAVVDQRLSLSGRLQTAGGYLDHARRTSFIVAALEDACPWVRGAQGVDLAHPVQPLVHARLAAHGGRALILFLVMLIMSPGPVQELAQDALNDMKEFFGVEEPAPRIDLAQVSGDAPAAAQLDEQESKQAKPAEAGAPATDQGGELSEQEKESKGSTGQGRSAEANSASTDSSARGAPSDQAQPSKEPDKRPKKGKRQEAKLKRKEKTRTRKTPEMSATTTGSGASKGSGRNPTASPWSSPEQAPVPDDSEIDEDEEIDDDDEEQESRGGVQPSMRDRRPPVSRDLRIGFGNRPNPDANGRGGPSQQKKSRGVASLVLGVPIPDRVKGRPGPGRTKVTQERVRPEAEQAQPQAARAGSPRAQPEGHLPELDLDPWLRGMVRDYFRRLREGPRSSSK